MCIQGIRIGQRLTGRGVSQTVPAGATVTLLGLNANRLRAVFSMVPDAVATAPQTVSIQANDGGTLRTAGAMSVGSPMLRMEVEQYGADLYNELVATNHGPAAVTVFATEYAPPNGLEGV